jgi:cysteine desulfurase
MIFTMSFPYSARYYFDWAATAAPDKIEEPVAAFANPSSGHEEGRKAREALENARSRCAAVLKVKPEQLYFSSGASESNAIVLFSMLMKGRKRESPGAELPGAGLLYSAGEHPSILENRSSLEWLGIKSIQTGLNPDSTVSTAALKTALKKNPQLRMAAIIGVQNETGAINDMAALTAIIRNTPGKGQNGPPVHVHCDLVQGVGKIPLDLSGWDIDSASFSAHKIGGPRGTGLLYLRKPLSPLVRGGGQERGLRPGTENIRGALALAAALETHADPVQLEAAGKAAAARMQALITRLRSTLPERFVSIPEDREDEDRRFSPWILQARFKGIPGEVLVRILDERGFALSTGSACSSGKAKRPVLEAMGLDGEALLEGIRISQGWSTSMDSINALADALVKVCGEYT